MSIRSFLFGKGIIKGKPLIDADNELRAFYSGEIEQWKEIYGGGGDWRYVSKGGINGGMRRMASLGAAKALCRELSDLCFSEQVDFSFSDKRVSEYVKDTLDENGFWDMFPDFLEKMFALGGGVIKVSYDNGVKLGFISCDDFFPTQWENGRIYGGAMITYIKRGDKRYALVERHEFEKRGYVITNTLFRCDSSITSGVPVQLSDVFPELAEETVIEGIDKPLFVYFRTNSANNLDFGNADNVLGISAFANATDTLKSLDVVFDSLQREFILGKKRIIVPTSAVRGEYDENGNLKKYFDVNDEVFQAFSENDSDDLRITDNSVQLRIEEHIKALDELLNLLCMQSGLSAGTLSYKTGTIKTATDGKLCFLWKSANVGKVNYVSIDLTTLSFTSQREITLSGAELTLQYPAFAEVNGFLYIPLDSTRVGKFTTEGVYVRDYAINASNAYSSVINGMIYYYSNNQYMSVINGNEICTVKRPVNMLAVYNKLARNVALEPPYIQSVYSDSGGYTIASNLYINALYLGTINNLAEPIIKTTNSTMKITYDIVNA